MIIHSDVPTSRVEMPKSLIDMVSERSSKAMYQSNRNASAIKSVESSTRNQTEQIAHISNELPKTMSKIAYISDTICEFPKLGENVFANVVTNNGKQIPSNVEVCPSSIKVHFESLNEIATVTITIL